MPQNAPRRQGRTLADVAATDRRRKAREHAISRILEHRLKCLSWWRAVATLFPGGVVDQRTAARVLGVSRQRVHQLIKAERLPSIGPMPGDPEGTVYVPIDALLGAPTPNQVGRPGYWAQGKEWLAAKGIGVNSYAHALKTIGVFPDFETKSQDSIMTPPKLRKSLDEYDLNASTPAR